MGAHDPVTASTTLLVGASLMTPNDGWAQEKQKIGVEHFGGDREYWIAK